MTARVFPRSFNMMFNMTFGRHLLCTAALALLAAPLVAAPRPAAAQTVANRTIGFVLVGRGWATAGRSADVKADCPNGFNDGPREQFAKLYPDDGKQRTLRETQLEREGDIWFPGAREPSSSSSPELPFYEVAGKTAIGMNLDGKVDANDFTSPDGEAGIDNQLYRAVGCVRGQRGNGGDGSGDGNMQRYIFNRILLELTEVDDLTNDPEVIATTYRGLDPLLASADGKTFLPGETQRADHRWGKRYIHRMKAKIVDGVLITEPTTITLPYAATFDTNTNQTFLASQWRMKLTPTSAEGMMGGYIPVKDWQHRTTINSSTHHSSYGQNSLPSSVRAVRRNADAYPDPKTGENTAISAAVQMKFLQAFIIHPEKKEATVASK